MPVATEKATSNGKPVGPTLPRRAVSSSPVARRRQVPWILAGVVLVVGCALAFAVASVRMSSGDEVLAVARPVPAGQALTAADLRPVRVSRTAGLSPVLAGAEASMLGRPAAVALVPGTLLTSGDMGSASQGAAGTDVVAMALKAGTFPPSLAGNTGPSSSDSARSGSPTSPSTGSWATDSNTTTTSSTPTSASSVTTTERNGLRQSPPAPSGLQRTSTPASARARPQSLRGVHHPREDPPVLVNLAFANEADLLVG
jgi:hypothetical protein